VRQRLPAALAPQVTLTMAGLGCRMMDAALNALGLAGRVKGVELSEIVSLLDELTRVSARVRAVADPMGLLVGLFAHAPIPLQVFRADGCCVLANKAFCTLFGHEPAPDYNVFADAVVARKGLPDFVRRGFAGKTVEVPAVWWDPPETARNDAEMGQRIAVEAVVLPLFDADSVARHVAVVFTDVTAQMQLAAEHARLTALMGHAVDVTHLQAADGSLLYVSPAVERVLGYTSEEAARLPVEASLHPSDLPRVRGIFAAAIQRPGEPLSAEYRARHKDGSWRWLTAVTTNLLYDPDVRAIATHYRDITEQRRIEEAIRASETQLAVTLDSIADSVIATDTDGRVARMNPAAERLTGWTLAEAKGRHLRDVFAIVNEDTLETVECPVTRVLRDGAVVGLANHTILRSRDGTERPIADSAAPIRDPSGQIRGVVLVFRDQTDQRRAEAIYRGLLESAPDAIIITKWNGEIVETNLQAQRLFAFAADEVRGQHIDNLIPQPGPPTGPQAPGSSPARTLPVRGRRKDGTTFPAEISASTLQVGDETLVCTGIRDVTDRIQMLDALRASEARFRAMSECSPLGIFMTDARFETMYANPAMCEIVGLGHDEAMGQGWTSTIHPEDRERMLAEVRACNEAGTALRTVVRHVHKNGKVVSAYVQSALMRDGDNLLGIIGTAQDITERVAVTQAVERARRDLYEIIERSPDGTAVGRDGRFVYVNRALARILGYASSEQLLGVHASDLIHPDDWPTAQKNMAMAPTGAELPPNEVRYRRTDGEYVVLERSVARLDEFDGAPALLLVFRDVTEKKKLQGQLLMSERMVSVGTLAAGMAHEINNPLATVLGNIDWMSSMLARLNEDCRAGAFGSFGSPLAAQIDRFDEVLRDTRDAGDRIRLVVRDVKVFSRAEEELQGPVAVTRVLDSAARMAHNEVRHRARFVRDYDRLPLAFGNEARLAQVFLNLIINAAQAIPEGHADANEIRVSAYLDRNDRIVVDVKDTGPGIPPEVVGRIFDPFFTTKPIGIGTGLGLTICQRIVTGFGGEIEVESSPGKGTVMRVRLVPTTAEQTPVPATPPIVHASRRGRVLVVDDEAAVAATMSRILEQYHDTEVVTRARDAIDLLTSGKRYDVIFCDVMMPEMTGMSFFEEISQRFPDVANTVVFVTGGAFTVRAREFLDRVPNQRIDKPFDATALLALVGSRIR
jgi:PAS domain S-box-containing protein